MLSKSVSIKLKIVIILFFISFFSKAQLLWPVADELHDRSYISNYVDNSSINNVFQDYQCGRTHGYDGHSGTDIAVHSFRQSDQGVPVIAAAGGVVTSMTNNQFDRNYWTPYVGSGNGLWIKQDDGFYAIYWHLRKHSLAVSVGERVEQGQFLGFVASSGSTPIPHLHFQLNNSVTLNDSLDPFSGNCGAENTYWQRQPDYVGNADLRILDFGMAIQTTYDGVFQGGEIKALKDRLPEPLQIGISSPNLSPWVQFQGNVGDQVTIRLRQPSGEIWYEFTHNVVNKRRYGWLVDQMDDANTLPSIEGDWVLQILSEDQMLAQKTFKVGDETQYPPLFYPISGASFVLNGAQQTYAMQEMGQAGSIEYRLIGAPEGVTLNGSQLQIAANTSISRRNHHFAVAAIDVNGKKDYFKVHLVDFNQPVENFSINSQINGNWYNPITDGRGVTMEVNEDNNFMFLTWYTFNQQAGATAEDAVGHGSQRWLVASGNYQRNVAPLSLYNVAGGTFDTADATVVSAADSYGKISVEFYNCKQAWVRYELFEENIKGGFPILKIFPGSCE